MRIRGISAVFAMSLPILAAAIGTSCITGSLLCCNVVEPATAQNIADLGSILSPIPPDIVGSIGLECTPVTLLGIILTPCANQLVCCSLDQLAPLVALGCEAPL
ncbi:hydrophobin-263 [Flammula alnicola]|nr:hydrophobin-263 [Flammula alnicola]